MNILVEGNILQTIFGCRLASNVDFFEGPVFLVHVRHLKRARHGAVVGALIEDLFQFIEFFIRHESSLIEIICSAVGQTTSLKASTAANGGTQVAHEIGYKETKTTTTVTVTVGFHNRQWASGVVGSLESFTERLVEGLLSRSQFVCSGGSAIFWHGVECSGEENMAIRLWHSIQIPPPETPSLLVFIGLHGSMERNKAEQEC
mmetsp:Transcript_28374/g.65846  ORF Transcript_28374/g.65846 Transcript_28374/m.65846 type:complete len:203 (-) Transcript_28374:61-669(-)